MRCAFLTASPDDVLKLFAIHFGIQCRKPDNSVSVSASERTGRHTANAVFGICLDEQRTSGERCGLEHADDGLLRVDERREHGDGDSETHNELGAIVGLKARASLGEISVASPVCE